MQRTEAVTYGVDTMKQRFSQQELYDWNEQLEREHPQQILEWLNRTFDVQELALATGFGAEGIVLIDMLVRVNMEIPIFYLDTGVLFPETYRLRDALEERYGIRFVRYSSSLSIQEQARVYGDRLWERNPDRCCDLRKVEPLRIALKGRAGWITAIRRDQSPSRADTKIVEWDEQFHLYKFNPLAAWKRSEVWSYIGVHELPYNPLYDRGYASVGCIHCTTPVTPGEDERAGRWRGFRKTECGIHVRDQRQTVTSSFPEEQR